MGYRDSILTRTQFQGAVQEGQAVQAGSQRRAQDLSRSTEQCLETPIRHSRLRHLREPCGREVLLLRVTEGNVRLSGCTTALGPGDH